MFKPLAGATAPPPARGERGEWRPLWPAPPDAPPAPDAHPTLGKPTNVWPYPTATGALGGYVCRYETADGGKEFRPLTYCEHSGTRDRAWRWKAFEPLRPLYGLDRLAKRPGAPVVVCEGEKAADAAARLLPGHATVTSSGGSKASRKADWGPLAGRRVVIWPDADDAGREYAAAVARRLESASADVSIVAPPDGAPPGWDAADAETEGWDHARALALVEAAAPAAEAMQGWHGAAAPSAGDTGAEKIKDKRGKTSKGGGNGPPQRDRLLAAVGDVELWHSADRRAFASAPVNGHVENFEVRSRDARMWFAGRYFQAFGGAIGGQAMQDALGVIEARAIYESPCYPVWRRVAAHDGAIFIDLVDDAWRAVEITPDGWRVIDSPSVRFLRSPAMLTLPEPEAGESIERLRGFVNVESDADFQLITGWVVAALRPTGPYPPLILNGEQGSAKSTVTKVLRWLIDPCIGAARSNPRDERDLFITAVNSHCLSFDNLSVLAGWLSDAFCRLSTGGGLATRELHSDRSEVVLDAIRPIILNGISALDARPDFGERAMVIILPSIGDGLRRGESEFWHDFHREHPAIFGALCDAVSCALRRLGDVPLPRDLRMADFAQWAEAAGPALGWEPGSFIRAYAENSTSAVRAMVEDDALASAIRQLAQEREHWEGSASELLPLVASRASERIQKHRSWPKTAIGLGACLGRLAPALRKVGVDVRRERRGRDGGRLWIIKGRADG